MPKRSRTDVPKPARKSTKKRAPEQDGTQSAYAVLQRVIEETEGTGKNPLAVALGRLGGLKGGRARAEKMTEEERSESASKAAQARWAGVKRSGS